jgi:hypothetical protein
MSGAMLTNTVIKLWVPKSRAIAEAVSRWLPTAAARVWQMGFVVDKMPSGQVFSEYFDFSLPKTFHSTNFSILTITRDRYNRPIHGRSAAWTQYELHLPLIIIIKKKNSEFQKCVEIS